MFVDILNQPDFSNYDISSVSGGGVGPRAARCGEGATSLAGVGVDEQDIYPVFDPGGSNGHCKNVGGRESKPLDPSPRSAARKKRVRLVKGVWRRDHSSLK